MSAQTRPSILGRSRSGRLLGLAVVSAVLSTLLVGDVAARPGGPDRRAEVRQLHRPRAPAGATAGACPSTGPTAPRSSGLDWKQILAFYYPGTTRTRPARPAACSRSGSPATPTAPSGCCRPPGLNVRDGVGGTFTVPTGHEVQVLADQAARLRLPAELPHRRRHRRHRADRSDQGHLVVLQPQQDRPGACCPAGRCGPTEARWR